MKSCAVPQCNHLTYRSSLRSGVKVKRSMFKVPSDVQRFKKWQIAIPNRILTSSHFVCIKHFEEHDIIRKYIRHDVNGRLIAEVMYKRPRLTESAVPTIFDEANEEKTFEGCDGFAIYKTHAASSKTAHDHSYSSIHESGVPMTNTTTFDISPVTISAGSSRSQHPVACLKSLPKPWVVGQLSALSNGDQCLLLLHPEVAKKRGGIEIPVTFGRLGTVTVDNQKNLRYFVHGNLFGNDEGNLRQKLYSLADLPDILSEFQRVKLCGGIGEVDIHFLPLDKSFKNYVDEWHHIECSLICSKPRCDSCSKLRRIVLQRGRRSNTTNLAIQEEDSNEEFDIAETILQKERSNTTNLEIKEENFSEEFDIAETILQKERNNTTSLEIKEEYSSEELDVADTILQKEKRSNTTNLAIKEEDFNEEYDIAIYP
ncbi:unnamed protein product [Brassicogethes aeneus]|uniref:THAP-type domain-containing protein n=1 Tax=Brassicogethes aeneus TaxID=1431903 RepID=A0A9P0B9W2_BRAAE|nr:unnamed protein product [Brassicogethes aeneus]